jgi:hypothetical protein
MAAFPRAYLTKGRQGAKQMEDISGARRIARRRLIIPAIALFLLSVVGLGNSIVMMVSPPAPIAAQELDPETQASMERGRTVAMMAGSPIVLIIYLVAAVGPVSMLMLQQRPVAIIGTVAAMLPCSFVFVVAIPFGIWALIALSSPVVKLAFAQSTNPPTRIPS